MGPGAARDGVLPGGRELWVWVLGKEHSWLRTGRGAMCEVSPAGRAAGGGGNGGKHPALGSHEPHTCGPHQLLLPCARPAVPVINQPHPTPTHPPLPTRQPQEFIEAVQRDRLASLFALLERCAAGQRPHIMVCGLRRHIETEERRQHRTDMRAGALVRREGDRGQGGEGGSHGVAWPACHATLQGPARPPYLREPHPPTQPHLFTFRRPGLLPSPCAGRGAAVGQASDGRLPGGAGGGVPPPGLPRRRGCGAGGCWLWADAWARFAGVACDCWGVRAGAGASACCRAATQRVASCRTAESWALAPRARPLPAGGAARAAADGGHREAAVQGQRRRHLSARARQERLDGGRELTGVGLK